MILILLCIVAAILIGLNLVAIKAHRKGMDCLALLQEDLKSIRAKLEGPKQ